VCIFSWPFSSSSRNSVSLFITGTKFAGHVKTILKETFKMEKSGSAKRGYDYAFWPEEGAEPKASLEEYPPEYEVFAPAKDL